MADSHDTTNPTRRAILAGAPAAAIGIGAVSAVGLAAFAASDEISQLLEIERRLIEISGQIAAQLPINEGCGRAMFKARRGYQPPARPDIGDPKDIWRYRQSKARYEMGRARMREESGLAVSEIRLQELRGERNDIGDKVWSIKATSLEALKIKARISKHFQPATFSAIDDLLEL